MRLKNTRIQLLFTLFCGLLANTSFGQRLDSISINTDEKFPQEKLYLHYDRPYYNAGETIWFKAYLTSSNLPAYLSKTVYAELLNEKGALLQRKIMPVIESGAASSFDLPDTLTAHTLYVKAYTAWMLNFDSTLLYFQPIKILSGKTPKATASKPKNNFDFFPEGGDLVEGITNRLAFKASASDGSPLEITGTIIDSKAAKVETFSSSHDGMGYVNFTPLSGEIYKASWKDKKGTLQETVLPVVKKQGVALSVNNIANQVKFTIERPTDANDDFKFFYILAEMQQQLVYSAKINLSSKTKVTAPIPTDSLPDGILKVTIFNASQIPVAERIVFINHGNYGFIADLNAIEINMEKRKQNTIQVDVGGTILSNLSISITDESLSTPSKDNHNIFSHLLLSSDLKGYIYNAAQYFESDDEKNQQNLDLVMMTNGWRRFKWEDLVENKMPTIKHIPENFLSITGTVFGPSKNQLKGKEITGILKNKNGGSEIFTMPVDENGKFGVTSLVLFDTSKLYYQFNQDKEKLLTSTSTFKFNPNYILESPKVNTSYFSQIPFSSNVDSALLKKNNAVHKLTLDQFYEGNKIKDLAVVVVKAKIKSPEQKMNEEYTSGFFTGNDGYTFLTENDPFAKTALTVLDYLQSKVAGLQVSTSGEGSISWRGNATSIFLNESTSDISMIKSVSMNDVAMIKVFRPPFFGATGGGSGGAVAVYLKKGASSYDNVKGLEFANIAGYSPIKEFYSPNYDNPLDFNNPTDLRITLYWNPFLIFDKTTRRIKIPFFNNDQTKKIRVVIEGLNQLGQLTREEKIFPNK